MTPISTLSIVMDASLSGVFTLFAALSWRIHEGPARTRLVTAGVVVAADAGGAVALRLLTGGGSALPIWYLPIYGMVLPALAYAMALHLVTLRARMRETRELDEFAVDGAERREQGALVRARQP